MCDYTIIHQVVVGFLFSIDKNKTKYWRKELHIPRECLQLTKAESSCFFYTKLYSSWQSADMSHVYVAPFSPIQPLLLFHLSKFSFYISVQSSYFFSLYKFVFIFKINQYLFYILFPLIYFQACNIEIIALLCVLSQVFLLQW